MIIKREPLKKIDEQEITSDLNTSRRPKVELAKSCLLY